MEKHLTHYVRANFRNTKLDRVVTHLRTLQAITE